MFINNLFMQILIAICQVNATLLTHNNLLMTPFRTRNSPQIRGNTVITVNKS